MFLIMLGVHLYLDRSSNGDITQSLSWKLHSFSDFLFYAVSFFVLGIGLFSSILKLSILLLVRYAGITGFPVFFVFNWKSLKIFFEFVKIFIKVCLHTFATGWIEQYYFVIGFSFLIFFCLLLICQGFLVPTDGWNFYV